MRKQRRFPTLCVAVKLRLNSSFIHGRNSLVFSTVSRVSQWLANYYPCRISMVGVSVHFLQASSEAVKNGNEIIKNTINYNGNVDVACTRLRDFNFCTVSSTLPRIVQKYAIRYINIYNNFGQQYCAEISCSTIGISSLSTHLIK